MMRFVAVVTVAFLLCAGSGAAQKVDISSQLRDLDVPEGLNQFLGAMVTEMQGMKEEYKKLQYEQNRTQSIEAELVRAQGEISWLKKDRDAFQNKTRAVEAENAALRIEVMELRKQTKNDLRHMNARLNQCEADSFAQVVERRKTQEQTPACGREAVDSMLAVCCAAPAGNGHRLQESVGCDSLPPTCSIQCSHQFISIFDNCHDDALMRGLSAEQLADWTSFYAVCSEAEQSAAEMSALQPVNVRMFRIMISSDAAQSQAEMFGGDGQTQPIIGPLPELPPPPPPASTSDSGSTDVQQYHAQCTTANILTCVPACNATHHGFELLATIDGTDTKFSCNLANQLFSWVGAAALGGYLGSDIDSFLSAINSGAAGAYIFTFVGQNITHDEATVQMRRGQHVHIVGGSSSFGDNYVWTSTVSGDEFVVLTSASLTITNIHVAIGGPTIVARQGSHLYLQNAHLSGGRASSGRYQEGSTIVFGDAVIRASQFSRARLYLQRSSVVDVQETVFRDGGITNDAIREGSHGTMYAGDEAAVTVRGCQFLHNRRLSGGAIEISDHANMHIIGSTFDGNVADGNGDGRSGIANGLNRGGAIEVGSVWASVVIESSVFRDNTVASCDGFRDSCGGDAIWAVRDQDTKDGILFSNDEANLGQPMCFAPATLDQRTRAGGADC